jgi:hypothetical protein
VDVLGVVAALVLFGSLIALAVLALVSPSNSYFRPARPPGDQPH